ncbi:FmdB family zinc ribbon protein [Antrihabitans cavernicola]|uniref:FmdB family transcriptional regulator n=1 Tax=Antrihabitans cavernicola TaxID=2495913 RepID=A0A5A7SCC2_9NOCA|nr:FmdB family zinc ribbon protein [Spelaeibacter cavernicola]KAA0023788.1 FmdB family transcriptional regulator [Spelaeibacter cavernicola]
MPTYSYACTECDNRFDIVQSFSDDTLTVCPECSGKLRKLFNSVGIVFKGSGFYRTDSRAGSTASEAAGEKSTTDKPKSDAPATAKKEKSDSTASSAGAPATKQAVAS